MNTLHQPASIMRMGGPSVDRSILVPLLVNVVAFSLLFTVLLVIRMRAALLERKIRALRVIEAESVPSDYGFAAAEPST